VTATRSEQREEGTIVWLPTFVKEGEDTVNPTTAIGGALKLEEEIRAKSLQYSVVSCDTATSPKRE